MKSTFAITTALSIFASAVTADVIVTKDGSTINGTILELDGGTLIFDTAFAGELEIDQADIVSVKTDDPIYLMLEDGTTYMGTVSGDVSSLAVDSSNGQITADFSRVKETWQTGEKSPSAIRAERKWTYEAAFDLAGKSGNKDSTYFGTSFRATLKGEDDTLRFSARANFEDTDGVKSADDARAGVSYAHNFSEDFNWYVRTAFGYDAIKEIEQYFTVAAGLGYTFFDEEKRFLGARAGVGYLYESYDDIMVNGMLVPREETNAASLDFGAEHRQDFKWGTWNTYALYTPTIEDFGNYRFNIDSSIDLPLKTEKWSIRAGINFDYDSEASESDLQELDTTYYLRMVLKWL